MRPKYLITKRFIGGTLDGITIKEKVSYKVRLGLVVASPCAGSPYKIIEVLPLNAKPYDKSPV